MGNAKFVVFSPKVADGAPYFDKTLNSHVCLVETILPNEAGNRWVQTALNRYRACAMNPADSAGVIRSDPHRLAKGVMGILVEAWVRARLRGFIERQNSGLVVSSTGPTWNLDGSFEQVDIVVSHAPTQGGACSALGLTIEVRSSFNYYSLHNAIFGGFRVLGPYSNRVKPGETPKGLYLFVAVDLHQTRADKKNICYLVDNSKQIDFAQTTSNIILNHTLSFGSDGVNIRTGFDLVLVGGATREMFNDAGLVKAMKGNRNYQNEEFKSIPIAKAMDAASILKRIMSYGR